MRNIELPISNFNAKHGVINGNSNWQIAGSNAKSEQYANDDPTIIARS
jgi:hypothetical protein